MREALGVEDTPEGEPTLVYTNTGITSVLQVGAAVNTVPITSVPILSYNSPSTVQLNPLPINIIVDPLPPASPLNNVTVAEFHWYKQDPNPALNQDKKGYFNLGDGFFKIGAEWVGFGPQTVALEGGDVVVNAIGTVNGSAGLIIGNGGSGTVASTSSGRLWVDGTGQLNFNHLVPATSTGNQVLFRPTYCDIVTTGNTAVGGGGQVVLPLTSISTVSSQGGVNHFSIVGNTAVLSATANTGVYRVRATVQLDTVTAGAQVAILHFKVNGNDVANSATRVTINATQETELGHEDFIVLNPSDAVSVVLSSADAAMTATTYTAVVGPPTIPVTPAVSLSILRIA